MSLVVPGPTSPGLLRILKNLNGLVRCVRGKDGSLVRIPAQLNT